MPARFTAERKVFVMIYVLNTPRLAYNDKALSAGLDHRFGHSFNQPARA